MNLDEYRARRDELQELWRFDTSPNFQPPYYVYRYYNDDAPIGHRLYYIGVTKEFFQRDGFHEWRSPWRVRLPVTRIEIEEYPNELEAKRAETLAIRYEIPCQNDTDNRYWRTTHPDGAHEPACDPDFARTGKTEMERKREAMEKLAAILSGPLSDGAP